MNARPSNSTLTITTKGQVTLRQDVLRHLGVGPGDKIAITALADGRVEVSAVRPSGDIADVFGAEKRDGQAPVSIEAMNEAIADGWAGRR
jgi:bifunctional DNA-binding transcriptional regulator/antitoxin component of YhaV-PrlF toxin-antitoxin module